MTKLQIVLLCLVCAILSTSFKAVPSKKQIVLMGFATVELFTSEGCSSCPPADELLAKLSREYAGKPVYFLSFHVDYWDNLGWKDPFSNHDYTERQKHYTKLLHADAYTPQAVVNGKTELIGSEGGNLHNLINAGLKIMPENSVAFGVSYTNNQLTLKYNLHSADDNDLLNIALVQERAADHITAGENKGAVINHVNVVRAFKTVKAQMSGSEHLTIPADLVGKRFRMILYTQDKNTWHITSGNSVLINPTR